MWGVYKDFILIDWFYEYYDALQCAEENEGVVYFFFGEPPKEL